MPFKWNPGLFLAIVTVNSAHTLVRENAHTYTLMSPVNSNHCYRVDNSRTFFMELCTSMQSYRLFLNKKKRRVCDLIAKYESRAYKHTHPPPSFRRAFQNMTQQQHTETLMRHVTRFAGGVMMSVIHRNAGSLCV